MSTPRKIDRRTQYTIQVIKDSLLALVAQQPFTKITVAQLCRQADINRSTFYLHFDSLTAVLNAVLDDALAMDTIPTLDVNWDELSPAPFDYLSQNESLIPICQRIGENEQYRALLLDPDLSEYIVGRIMAHERPHSIPAIMAKTGLDKHGAETLFTYVIHGSFAVNQRHRFVKDEQWARDVKLLNQFIKAGYQHFKH